MATLRHRAVDVDGLAAKLCRADQLPQVSSADRKVVARKDVLVGNMFFERLGARGERVQKCLALDSLSGHVHEFCRSFCR